eukprot:TRINITY_DN18874_c3_g2_i1.p1 TRINITY_DN18874_c3_g2~~TRINITY_DN18874_c3_g2_i1.p1  ORF type:complete len:1422 (+),score=405.98 TRINITY_DN18874_c3_g2_i1:126-4268(+)
MLHQPAPPGRTGSTVSTHAPSREGSFGASGTIRRSSRDQQSGLQGASRARSKLQHMSAIVMGAVAAKRLRKVSNRRRTGPEPLDEAGGEMSAASIEEMISLEQLERLRSGFEHSPTGTLTESQFVEVLRPLLPRYVGEDVLHGWFTAVDFTGNGILTWDEFSSYLVHRNQHKLVQEELRFSYQRSEDPAPPLELCHRDMVTVILPHSSTGRVFTCGRDGVTRSWAPQTLQPERVIHNAGAWITSACFLRDEKRFLIASVDRQLSLFDSTTGALLRTYAGRKHVARHRDESISRKHVNDTKKYGLKIGFRRRPLTTIQPGVTLEEFAVQMSDVLAGDRMSTFEVSITPMLKLLEPPMSICYIDPGSGMGKEQVGMGLLNGTLSIYPVEPSDKTGRCHQVCTGDIHSQCISQVRFSPYLTGVITSSWDSTLKVFNVEKQKEAQTFGGPNGHQKAVCSFDWCDGMQILASCGSERRVYMWNPFLSQPVFKLDGHQQSLVDVCLNSDNRQLITLSEDKVIKVWDVRTFRCLQTITDSTNYHPDNFLSAMAFDAGRNRVLTASTYPCAWLRARVSSAFPPNYTGHTRPILQILYNVKLRQVVTADREQVTAWDLDSGQKVSQFRPAKQMQQSLLRVGTAITRIALDHRQTRLITATEHATVVVWNLRNFQVCAVGESGMRHVSECTALLHCQRKGCWFVCCAAGPTMCIFQDSDELTSLRVVGSYNTAALSRGGLPPSISCMALPRDSMYALGLDDGRIALYNPDIGRSCGVLGGEGAGGGVEALHVLDVSPLQLSLGAPELVLMAALGDGQIQLWDTARRRTIGSFQTLPADGEAVLTSFAVWPLDAASRLIAVGDSEGCAHVWQIRETPPGGPPEAVEAPQQGRRRSRAYRGSVSEGVPSGGRRRSRVRRDSAASDVPDSLASPIPIVPQPPPEPPPSGNTAVPDAGAGGGAGWPLWLLRPSLTQRLTQVSGDAVTAVAFLEMAPGPTASPRAARTAVAAPSSPPLLAVGGADCFCCLYTLLGRKVGTAGVDSRWARRAEAAAALGPLPQPAVSPSAAQPRAPRTDLLTMLQAGLPGAAGPPASADEAVARSPPAGAGAAPAPPALDADASSPGSQAGSARRRRQQHRILRQRPPGSRDAAADAVVAGAVIAAACGTPLAEDSLDQTASQFFITAMQAGGPSVPGLDFSSLNATMDKDKDKDRRPLTAATPLLPQLQAQGTHRTSAWTSEAGHSKSFVGSEPEEHAAPAATARPVGPSFDVAAVVARRSARLAQCGVQTEQERLPDQDVRALRSKVSDAVTRSCWRPKQAQRTKGAWQMVTDSLQRCVKQLQHVDREKPFDEAQLHARRGDRRGSEEDDPLVGYASLPAMGVSSPERSRKSRS